MSTPATARIFYLDFVRVALTMLVIAHHVGQAYGPTGGYWPVQEQERAAILGPFFTVNRSFFMSLFFLISGYFTAAGLERHAPGSFARGRLVRLGIPVLAFAAMMLPARLFLFGEKIARWDDYFNAGHLWYLEHVLLFSLVYAAWRHVKVPAAGKGVGAARGRAPGFVVTATCLLGTTATCALVRVWSPIDVWLNLLGFFRVAFADVPRDLTFYVIGVLAFRRGWLETYPTGAGLAWLAAGALAGASWYVYRLVPAAAAPLSVLGRFYPLWEGVVCFGFCIGLMVLCRQIIRGQGSLGRFLAANQYSAYFWHPLLIVPIQMGALALRMDPLAKFAVVTIVGVPVAFLWSWLLRLNPGVRAVL